MDNFINCDFSEFETEITDMDIEELLNDVIMYEEEPLLCSETIPNDY